MELEIQIVRDPCQDQAKQRLRVFGETGGTIGRAPDSYWTLPDPKNYVSGHHCDVEYEGDGFWVRDTSRNGVFLNDATDRVGYGHKVRVDDGDRLRVGLYELVVKLRDHGRHVTQAREHLSGGAAAAAQVDEQLGRTTVNLDSTRVGEHSSPSGLAVNAVVSEVPLSSTGSHRVVKLDRVALRGVGLLPPEAQERLMANQFRQIKRALIANAFGRGVTAMPNGRLLMVTSALPGEGKTFSTINLTYYQVLNASANEAAAETPSFGEKVKGAFRTGWEIVSNLFIVIITIWPLLLGSFFAFLLYKKMRVQKPKQA
jgi:predicted component of type VI protein secretion system